jgi:hypothetical protein
MDYSADDCVMEISLGQIDRMYTVWSLFRATEEQCGDSYQTLQLDFEGFQNWIGLFWELEATTINFAITSEDGFDYNGDINTKFSHDMCIAPGTDYEFVITQTHPTTTGTFRVSVGGQLVGEGTAFGAKQRVAFRTAGNAPTTVPSAGPLPSVPITFVIDFDGKTEDYALMIVSRDDPKDIIVDYQFDHFQESVHANTVYTETVQVAIGRSYKFIISERAGVGLEGSYSVYSGPVADESALLFHEVNFNDASDEVTFTIDAEQDTPTLARLFAFKHLLAGDNTVYVQNKGKVSVKNLRIGDRVKVDSSDTFEPLYSFAHNNPNLQADFVQVTTATMSSLLLTDAHMVFINERHAIPPVSKLHVGDMGRLASGDEDAGVSTARVHATGVFAPLTKSGMLVVSNVQASTFVALQDSEYLTIAGISTNLSFQWLTRMFEIPHQIWCGSLSLQERYDAEGISTYHSRFYGLALWFGAFQ